MQHLLDQARMTFGQPEARKFSTFDMNIYLSIPRPSWCNQSDQLYCMFQVSKQLLTDGVIVWAHIVQANTLLFTPGDHDCPASVVFAPNPQQYVNLGDLERVAQSLFRLKGTSPSDPELKVFADNITNEYTRTFGLKVPEKLCPNVDLYEATTFVSRKHLPNKVLSLPFFPLLVAQQSPYYNFPLPTVIGRANLWTPG